MTEAERKGKKNENVEIQEDNVTENEQVETAEQLSSDAGIDTVDQEPEAEIVSQKAKFSFREPSKERKEKGEKKREAIELTLPYLTYAGLVTALTSDDTKVVSFVLDIVNDQIYEAAREQVNDTAKPVNSQEELDESKLSLEYLANRVSERKTSGISKELWTAFEAKYIEVMPELINKDVAKIEKAAKIFVARYQPVKTMKKVIETLQPMLGTFFNSLSDEDKAEYLPVVAFLDKKAEEYLSVTDDNMLKDLV